VLGSASLSPVLGVVEAVLFVELWVPVCAVEEVVVAASSETTPFGSLAGVVVEGVVVSMIVSEFEAVPFEVVTTLTSSFVSVRYIHLPPKKSAVKTATVIRRLNKAISHARPVLLLRFA
jgi:hypothetical protein